MPTLTEIIAQPESRRRLVEDTARLVDAEVATKSGLAGFGVKAAFTMAKALKPGLVADAVNHLLPEFAAKLEPILAGRAGERIAIYFGAHEGEVVQALLGVTDARAERPSVNPTLRQAYYKLRPSAQKHVQAAVPGLATVLERHLG